MTASVERRRGCRSAARRSPHADTRAPATWARSRRIWRARPHRLGPSRRRQSRGGCQNATLKFLLEQPLGVMTCRGLGPLKLGLKLELWVTLPPDPLCIKGFSPP